MSAARAAIQAFTGVAPKLGFLIMTSASLLAVFGLGGPELLLILAVVLLLFGAKKLPELAKGLGRSVKEFKKASNEIEEEEQAAKPAPVPVANAEAKKPESTTSTSTP